MQKTKDFISEEGTPQLDKEKAPFNELTELFNEYDNSGNVPSSGFSAEQIRAENEKVKKTVEIIQAAFEEIKKEGREIFENFNVNFEKQNNIYTDAWMDLCKLLAFFWGCILGSVIHIIRMKVSKEGRMLAMGPYLSMGIMLAVLYGNRFLDWYLSLLGF